MQKNKKERVHCNNCGGKKYHDLLHHEKISWSEDIAEDFIINGEDIYDLLKCCGCECVTIRHKCCHSEDIDPETGEISVSIRYYPPPSYRKKPEWLSEFLFLSESEDAIKDLVREIYIALQNDATKLAVMGIRALIEIVMIDKVGDNGTFKKNLNKFEQEGYISAKQREVLESVLEAGHAVIHRAFSPIKNDVPRLMDIAENIIETIYMNENRAEVISRKTPSRQNIKKM